MNVAGLLHAHGVVQVHGVHVGHDPLDDGLVREFHHARLMSDRVAVAHNLQKKMATQPIGNSCSPVSSIPLKNHTVCLVTLMDYWSSGSSCRCVGCVQHVPCPTQKTQASRGTQDEDDVII